MSYSLEFETVELLIGSSSETRGVDAFALSIIKAERQLRRLFTHLVFQFPCFTTSDIPALRSTLAGHTNVYFQGFEAGFDALSPRTVAELLGTQYQPLRLHLDEAIDARNKIFHGQLTDRYLSRADLLNHVADIRAWCRLLADQAISEIGYDGFGRDSFQKSTLPTLWSRLQMQFASTADYAAFISNYMARRPRKHGKRQGRTT